MPHDRPARAPWRRGEPYAYLRHVERAMFAWEWLRRTDAYRAAWQNLRTSCEHNWSRTAHSFGLVEFLSPTLSAMIARPMWRAGHDPRVIAAAACTGDATEDDRLDIRQLANLAAVAINEEDIEHWRIGTAARSLRLDVRAGTLLGGPTALQFELRGLARVRTQLGPLAELIDLGTLGPGPPISVGDAWVARWILELRTADALASGANQQDIARGLFSHAVSDAGWRLDTDSARSRTRRLIRAAEARLAEPLDDYWFR